MKDEVNGRINFIYRIKKIVYVPLIIKCHYLCVTVVDICFSAIMKTVHQNGFADMGNALNYPICAAHYFFDEKSSIVWYVVYKASIKYETIVVVLNRQIIRNNALCC